MTPNEVVKKIQREFPLQTRPYGTRFGIMLRHDFLSVQN